MDKSAESLLEDARKFRDEALGEFEDGLREGSTVKLRDSAEKAWNAVVQAANALVLRYEGYLPRSHYERRKALRALEERNKSLADYGVYDRYVARSRLLHGEVFYEGVLDPEMLKLEIEKASGFIKLVEEHIR